jgi:hypothetical protein
MRTVFVSTATVLVLVLLTSAVASAVPSPKTVHLGPITRPGMIWPGGASNRWNLQGCDLVVTYRLTMGQYVPPYGTTQWTSIGVSNGTDPRGWLSAGAPYAADVRPLALDLDDKWNLGAPGRLDEWSYDVVGSAIVPSPIGNPAANYGIWFDRTGVDPYQALLWGAASGVTYNTGGSYTAQITFHGISTGLGTMVARVNGVPAGIYAGSWRNAPPDYVPVGKSFTADVTSLRVFGAVTAWGVRVSDWKATGCQ